MTAPASPGEVVAVVWFKRGDIPRDAEAATTPARTHTQMRASPPRHRRHQQYYGVSRGEAEVHVQPWAETRSDFSPETDTQTHAGVIPCRISLVDPGCAEAKVVGVSPPSATLQNVNRVWVDSVQMDQADTYSSICHILLPTEMAVNQYLKATCNSWIEYVDIETLVSSEVAWMLDTAPQMYILISEILYMNDVCGFVVHPVIPHRHLPYICIFHTDTHWCKCKWSSRSASIYAWLVPWQLSRGHILHGGSPNKAIIPVRFHLTPAAAGWLHHPGGFEPGNLPSSRVKATGMDRGLLAQTCTGLNFARRQSIQLVYCCVDFVSECWNLHMGNQILGVHLFWKCMLRAAGPELW